MKIKLKAPKPRNEFVAAARFRRSGPHGKTNKANRRGSKVSLRKEI